MRLVSLCRKVAKSKQIHGDQILIVSKAGNYEGYDALITDQRVFCWQ